MYPKLHKVKMQHFNMSFDTFPEEKKLYEKNVRSETVPGSNVPLFTTSLSERTIQWRAEQGVGWSACGGAPHLRESLELSITH